ncbi:MAG: prolyl oligopeptidase family serine peptidase [Candidatus Latescibacteria bacterium]|nr:prolyl oligopeptidase family serine peptidase [Candidatus Latescibacterota bacterium]
MSQSNPETFIAQAERPGDFDAFWDSVLAQVEAMPLNAQVEVVPLRSTPEVEVYEVHYDSLDGVRIAAWYCLPAQRQGPLPAIVQVPGYIGEPGIPVDWARAGYAALGVAPRGKLRSNGQFNPGYPGLLTHNIVDRHTYGYRGFYIDAVRAFDWLTDRDEVDRARVGVSGSSQGGGLTLAVAALRPQVRAASVGAPYLCGFMDAIELTDTYPYQEISDYLRFYPERRDAVQQTLEYFDGLHFAPKISCPIIVNLGLQDNICPPETGYALFRELGANDKQLYTYDQCGHDAGGAQHQPVIAEFFARQLKS